MSVPGWIRGLLRLLAPADASEDVLGDLEASHRRRARRHARPAASILTTLEALDMAAALVRSRFIRLSTNKGNTMLQDYRIGIRMLLKYPGLTLAGGPRRLRGSSVSAACSTACRPG